MLNLCDVNLWLSPSCSCQNDSRSIFSIISRRSTREREKKKNVRIPCGSFERDNKFIFQLIENDGRRKKPLPELSSSIKWCRQWICTNKCRISRRSSNKNDLWWSTCHFIFLYQNLKILSIKKQTIYVNSRWEILCI
jgi:hypothetical protein